MARANEGFRYLDRELFCENLSLSQLRAQLPNDVANPFFVYSKKTIEQNIAAYRLALEKHGLKFHLGYSLKANSNFHLLRIVRDQGCLAITVSGNEVKLALLAGFHPAHIILNGNGKQLWELELAIQQGCLVNVDSHFDAFHIVQLARRLKSTCRLLLRVNLSLDAEAHPYNCTALPDSKFGTSPGEIGVLIETLASSSFVDVVGLHCHVGSTVHDVGIYSQVAQKLLDLAEKLRNGGHDRLCYINIGGGLGIDYKKAEGAALPSPEDLVETVAPFFRRGDYTLIIEPGRSIIGNSAVLVSDVIGVKTSTSGRKFVVTTAAMTEVIRPCLYSAFHYISAVRQNSSNEVEERYDVVGPVCESGDFLGKDRLLPRLEEGSLIAVWDVGAYCYAMSSNYNLRGRVAEVLVDGHQWSLIRRPETLEDVLRTCPGVLLQNNNSG